jgi:hypothetical protein
MLTTKRADLFQDPPQPRAVKTPAAIFLHSPVAQFRQLFLTEKLCGIR